MISISQRTRKEFRQSGNVLFIVLLAIILIGALSVAIQGTSRQSAHIDNETLLIRITEVQRYASELERGIGFIMQNGHSEADIRFAHPNANADYGNLNTDADPSDQVFDYTGGGVEYRAPPSDVNDGSAWEFYGHTAMPEVGSDEAELLAVLPNVTQNFCQKINDRLGYDSATQPQDTATCINGGATMRFDAGTQFASTPNTVSAATFTVTPSLQGCVECTSDGSYHFFHVLMAR